MCGANIHAPDINKSSYLMTCIDGTLLIFISRIIHIAMFESKEFADLIIANESLK